MSDQRRPPGTPELWQRFPELLRGSHPTLDWMVSRGASLTREEYLLLDHLPDPVPDPYPAELEAMLPNAFKLEPRQLPEPRPDPMETVLRMHTPAENDSQIHP